MQEFFDLIFKAGFAALEWRMIVMWAVVLVMLYLAVFKQFEPLLLVPIAFGALLANLPTRNMVNEPAGELYSPVDGIVVASSFELGETITLPSVVHEQSEYVSDKMTAEAINMLFKEEAKNVAQGNKQLLYIIRPDGETVEKPLTQVTFAGKVVDIYENDHFVWASATSTIADIGVGVGDDVVTGTSLVRLYSKHTGGLFHYLSLGIVLELFPPLIFLGVGAMTDFGPLIANPRTLLLGAAAQFGVFATYLGAMLSGLFDSSQSAAIGIIGGADGPTSIFLANALAPELLAPIAVAAYSYMALVPVIQPPIMRALTTEKERVIRMSSLRKVSRLEKLIFALLVTVFCVLLVPDASPLIGMLLLGNFIRECGVTERLSKAAQNELINICTIFLGTSVGITMTGDRFLKTETLAILGLGIVAFSIATACGVLMAKTMNVFSKNKINPLIGSAGVSAVPMAARVSQVEGQKADSGNFLLMHAMGPNVAGVIGTALVAGYFMTVFRGGH